MQWDKKMWMSVIIAVIMIASVIGFAIEFSAPTNPPIEYHGYKFVSTQQGYRTAIKNTNVFFYNPPQQLEELPFDEGAKTALNDARVFWVTYDPADEHASEIADTLYYLEQALDKVSPVYVQRGLLNATGYPLPEITCANATTRVPVLIMRSGNETAITATNGCVIATAASRNDVYQLGDRLLYRFLGVMS